MVTGGEMLQNQHLAPAFGRLRELQLHPPRWFGLLHALIALDVTLQFALARFGFLRHLLGVAANRGLPRFSGELHTHRVHRRAVDVAPNSANLFLLIAPLRALLLLLPLPHLDIGAVIASVFGDGVRLRIEIENARDGVIQKGAVVGDDQRRARIGAQPRFEPLQRLDVEMVGRLVEQHHIRALQQQPRQSQARLLPAAEDAERRLEADMRQPQARQHGFSLVFGGLHRCQGFQAGERLAVRFEQTWLRFVGRQRARERRHFRLHLCQRIAAGL